MEFTAWILVGLLSLVVIGQWLSGKVESFSSPPTDRQLDFIDDLIEERQVETSMLEKEPATVEEASELIDKLKSLPYRD